MKKFSFTIGVIFSCVALYLTLINVPLDQLWNDLISVKFQWVILSIIINCISFILRAFRWQLIVKEIQYINFWEAYHPTSIAFMMNSILPGRIGELARPVILSQNKKIPLSGGFATIVTERIFDVIILILLYAVVFLHVDIDPNFQMEIGKYTLSKTLLSSLATQIFFLFSILLMLIVCINIYYVRLGLKKILFLIPQLFKFTGKRTTNFILHKCIVPITNIIDHVADGFSFLKRVSRIIYCFFLSVVIWLLVAVSYYVMSFGYQNLHISFFEMCAVLVMICFFISLPSVPGYWGIWEAGGVFAMTIFGIGEKEAIGFTIVNHAFQIFPIIIAGIISAFLTGTSIFSSINYKAIEKEEKE